MFRAEYDNGVYTNHHWYRPDMESVLDWYVDLKSQVDASDYEIRLIGAVAEGVKTWDVDVILMGEPKDYYNLKEILTTGQILGFQHSLLVDIFWTNTYVADSIKENKDMSDCKRIRNHKTFKKTINGVDEFYDFTYGYTYNELIPGLYEYIGAPIASIQKTTKRLNESIYKGIYTELEYVV